jgi:hypothetical protein
MKMVLDKELERLTDLQVAVQHYIAHSMAVDAGVGHDKVWVDHWYSEMVRLTGDDNE